jgi:hypothetical protein
MSNEIEKNWPNWQRLKELLKHAGGIKEAQELEERVKIIENQRRLLDEPDLVGPLLKSLENTMRGILKELDSKYEIEHKEGMERLEVDDNWKSLNRNSDMNC